MLAATTDGETTGDTPTLALRFSRRVAMCEL